MNNSILEAKNVSKKYEGKTVLQDISLLAGKGEAIGLVGVNGCGKSTLLRILSGLSNPSSGQVSCSPGIRMALIPDRYEKINMTLQKFMDHMYRMETDRENRDEMGRYFREFHLESMLDTPMKYLSKGTLQKAGVIQALLGRRELLFLDEPLSGQDTLSQMTLIQELKKRKAAGMTLIMACHETYLIEELADRIYDGKNGEGVFLPKTFAPINCKNVFVEGVTFERGLYWNIVPQYCEHILIRGITVNSFGHGRTDGIDIDSSNDVLIEYCSLDCQDDCYTMKSGRGKDGLKVNRPTSNVVIRKSIALRGAGGIVCGTEIAGGVRNVYMYDCVFEGTDQAFRFKTRRPRGGFVENIYVERVRANVKRQALYCDMLGSARWVGELAQRYPAREITPLTPWFANISIHDVEITGCSTLVDVSALPEKPVKNFFFGNVKAHCDRIGKICDATKFSMKDVRIESCDTVMRIDNCDYASFFGFSNVTTGSSVKIEKTGGECRYLNVQTYPLVPVNYQSIRPGEVWLDTEGKPIQAHGFQVTFREGKYYWYGEDKTHTLFGTNRMFGGVRCYSSTDFYNWKDEGRIIEPATDPHSPLHHCQKLERPHILYCAKTGRYVCWLKSQSNDGHFVILEAEHFMGPYHFVRNLKPNGFAVGDFDMYADPDTGKGYVWFERPHWEQICAELSDDYTNVNGRYSEHFVGKVPPFTREAAAHFVMDGKHYIYTSGTTSYTPNPSEVAVFDDYHGEYTVLGNPHIGDEYAHSFCSQITSVIKIPGKDLYVAMADRWLPHTNKTDIPKKDWQSFLTRYKDHRPYPKDFATPKVADRFYTLVNPNQDVYKATYVFLPIVVKDGIPMIEWKDEWKLENYE